MTARRRRPPKDDTAAMAAIRARKNELKNSSYTALAVEYFKANPEDGPKRASSVTRVVGKLLKEDHAPKRRTAASRRAVLEQMSATIEKLLGLVDDLLEMEPRAPQK